MTALLVWLACLACAALWYVLTGAAAALAVGAALVVIALCGIVLALLARRHVTVTLDAPQTGVAHHACPLTVQVENASALPLPCVRVWLRTENLLTGQTAAAALARGEDCEGMNMICLPEVPFNIEHFIDKVERMQRESKSVVIAVSEGVKNKDGVFLCDLVSTAGQLDAFGHKAILSGTSRYLADLIRVRLGCKTRAIEFSTLQRCASHLASRTDITEAYQVGGAAAKAAFEGHTGEMVALDRISNAPYQCGTSLHPISEVANLEKKVPLEWVNADHTAMTEEFLAYALPLVQAELTPIYVEGLPHHIYLPEA